MKTNNEGKRITTMTVALLVAGDGATLLTQRKKFPPKEKFLCFPKKFFYSYRKITNFSNGESFLHLSEKKFNKWKKLLYLYAGKLISHTCVKGISLFIYLSIYLFICLFIFQRDPFQMSFVYGPDFTGPLTKS